MRVIEPMWQIGVANYSGPQALDRPCIEEYAGSHGQSFSLWVQLLPLFRVPAIQGRKGLLLELLGLS